MRRYYFILLISAIVLIVLQVYAQQRPPVELLEIRDSKFEQFGPYRYPSVWFSHELHTEEYQVTCNSCHHLYKNGQNIWTSKREVQECSDCHGKTKQELTIAYHMKCWGCHKRIKEIYLPADVPTVECDRCHIKSVNLTKEERRIKQKLKNKQRKVGEIIKHLKIKGFYR